MLCSKKDTNYKLVLQGEGHMTDVGDAASDSADMAADNVEQALQ